MIPISILKLSHVQFKPGAFPGSHYSSGRDGSELLIAIYLLEDRPMDNTYEAFVDIKEYDEKVDIPPHIFTKRYVVDAENRFAADRVALLQAEHDYPKATEFDVRMGRLIH